MDPTEAKQVTTLDQMKPNFPQARPFTAANQGNVIPEPSSQSHSSKALPVDPSALAKKPVYPVFSTETVLGPVIKEYEERKKQQQREHGQRSTSDLAAPSKPAVISDQECRALVTFGSENTSSLKAVTINGSMFVETSSDAVKRQEERKNRKRKSRWGDSKPAVTEVQKTAPSPHVQPKKSTIVLDSGDSTPAEVASAARASAASACIAAATKAKEEAQQEALNNLIPTQIDASKMTEEEQQCFLLKVQIQDITNRLTMKDLGIPADPRARSPSPEPIYNSKGIRINKREERVRNRLLNERNTAITKLKLLDPTYQPPAAYQYRNTLLEARVYIPAEEHPQINFMGLLLGPRGNYLEEMKKRTKCNIIIRGKGTLKSGMTGINKDGKKFEALDEPMHAFITGPTPDDVQSAVKEIEDLINMQVYNPDCEKAVAMRARSMHDLALLNGTVKDIDQLCTNCGKSGHKSWQCDESTKFSASLVCSACGGIGHLTSDCKKRRPGAVFNQYKETTNKEEIDAEYDSFLSDLGMARPKEAKKEEPAYVPPMGLDHLKSAEAPRMLTNASNVSGQPSTQTRFGTSLQTVGKSIFGGKMTRMTAGFKTHNEMEREREQKKIEYANRPIPLEWQVEKYENSINKHQEQYMKNLERTASSVARASAQPWYGAPPSSAPGSSRQNHDSSFPTLPNIIGNPMSNLKR